MNYPRRLYTPLASNKRKDRDGFDAFKPPAAKIAKPGIPRPGSPSIKSAEPASRNLLLAGYLAHEFLTKGTLMGEKWDQARAEAVPFSAAASELKRSRSIEKGKSEPNPRPELKAEKYQRYVEVSSLLKTDGAHIPGIVNPTQLAGFLHM